MTVNYIGKNNQKKSIYTINLSSADGQDVDMLTKNTGKVTLIINVTGHCGNAPQFGIIEEIYQKYKDHGLKVLAIPTNDFCGPGITYGIYEKGVADALMAKDYATNKWGVTYEFGELITSRAARKDDYDRLNRVPHELYQNLNPDGEESPMEGNFEKFLIDKSGKAVYRFPNCTLLNFGYENGICDSPEVEKKLLEEKIEELLSQEWDGRLYNC